MTPEEARAVVDKADQFSKTPIPPVLGSMLIDIWEAAYSVRDGILTGTRQQYEVIGEYFAMRVDDLAVALDALDALEQTP